MFTHTFEIYEFITEIFNFAFFLEIKIPFKITPSQPKTLCQRHLSIFKSIQKKPQPLSEPLGSFPTK